MRNLIIYAHPNPKSFNHAILDTTVQSLQETGYEVMIRDLYAMKFDPVLKSSDFEALQSGKIQSEIRTEQDYIAGADVLTLIYPIWWTGLPALLKGYIDRVFSYGFAYKTGDDGPVGLLTGKKAFIINTHGTPTEIYDSSGMTEALRKTSDTGIFNFCGIEVLGHVFFGAVATVDDDIRHEMLNTLRKKLNTLF